MKFLREPLNWIAMAVLIIALCYVAQTIAAFRQADQPIHLGAVVLDANP